MPLARTCRSGSWLGLVWAPNLGLGASVSGYIGHSSGHSCVKESLGCPAVTFRVDAGFSQKSAGRYGCSGCIAVCCRYLHSAATMSAFHLCSRPLVIATGRGVIVPIDGMVAHEVFKLCGTLIQSSICLFLAPESMNAMSTFSCMYWAAFAVSL